MPSVGSSSMSSTLDVGFTFKHIFLDIAAIKNGIYSAIPRRPRSSIQNHARREQLKKVKNERKMLDLALTHVCPVTPSNYWFLNSKQCGYDDLVVTFHSYSLARHKLCVIDIFHDNDEMWWIWFNNDYCQPFRAGLHIRYTYERKKTLRKAKPRPLSQFAGANSTKWEREENNLAGRKKTELMA